LALFRTRRADTRLVGGAGSTVCEAVAVQIGAVRLTVPVIVDAVVAVFHSASTVGVSGAVICVLAVCESVTVIIYNVVAVGFSTIAGPVIRVVCEVAIVIRTKYAKNNITARIDVKGCITRCRDILLDRGKVSRKAIRVATTTTRCVSILVVLAQTSSTIFLLLWTCV
jgi:hypothetical protein